MRVRGSDDAPLMSLALIDRADAVLRGRLAGPVELRSLPSGETLLQFTLAVRRERPGPGGPESDLLSCVSTVPGLLSRAQAWGPGDVIEVEGALQRRFWRTPTGTAVTHEVGVRAARKASRSGPRTQSAVGTA